MGGGLALPELRLLLIEARIDLRGVRALLSLSLAWCAFLGFQDIRKLKAGVIRIEANVFAEGIARLSRNGALKIAGLFRLSACGARR